MVLKCPRSEKERRQDLIDPAVQVLVAEPVREEKHLRSGEL